MTIPLVIVDDDEIDRYLTRRTVDDADGDFKFIEYSTGHDFLEVFRNAERRHEEIGGAPPPTLVLLDINMPRMSGFEVLEELAKDSVGFEQMVVVMFSSSSHAQDKENALAYDFVKTYIVKPLTREKLQGLVDQFYS